jgi:hypothetical protein
MFENILPVTVEPADCMMVSMNLERHPELACGIPAYSVLTLLEIMKRFDAWGLAKLFDHMQSLRELAREAIAVNERNGAPNDYVPSPVLKDQVLSIIIHALHHANNAHLESTYDRVWENGQFAMLQRLGMTWQQLDNELVMLRQCIENDLEKQTFIFIPKEHAKYLYEIDKPWKAIWRAIPGAKGDIFSGVKCYALELPSATVFHFMRVAEFGLRQLAGKLHVKLTHKGKNQPIEYADWEKVITGIKNKIAAARLLQPGPKRQEKLEIYSDAGDHCTFMKDIWRNNISHARKAYKMADAAAVMDRVRDFMRFVAENN